MARKTFAIFFLIPLMIFFAFNGVSISPMNEPLLEAGSEIPTAVTTQKVYYLLPENELELPENKEFAQGRKYKLKDPHKFNNKHFHR